MSSSAGGGTGTSQGHGSCAHRCCAQVLRGQGKMSKEVLNEAFTAVKVRPLLAGLRQLGCGGASRLPARVGCRQLSTARARLGEAVPAAQDLIAEGKVRRVGVSEMAADDIRAAHAIVPVSLCELEWSLFARDCEQDLVPTCRELGIGFMAYSPMGRGLLTGQLDLSKLDAKVRQTTGNAVDGVPACQRPPAAAEL